MAANDEEGNEEDDMEEEDDDPEANKYLHMSINRDFKVWSRLEGQPGDTHQVGHNLFHFYLLSHILKKDEQPHRRGASKRNYAEMEGDDNKMVQKPKSEV